MLDPAFLYGGPGEVSARVGQLSGLCAGSLVDNRTNIERKAKPPRDGWDNLDRVGFTLASA